MGAISFVVVLSRLHLSAVIRQVKKVPKIAAAQENPLKVQGVASFYLGVGDQKTLEPVEVLVVEELVVPLLIGTTWIDIRVAQIEPRTREVSLEFPRCAPSRVPLTQTKADATIWVSKPRCLPAFTETLVEVGTARSGLSLIRPLRNRTGSVQEKNGVAELPIVGQLFQCWVANLSNRPMYLRKGQVVDVDALQESHEVFVVPVHDEK